MLVQILLALAFIPTCRLLRPCTKTPCTSKEYQKEMKQGFDVNWFKAKRPFCHYDDKMIEDVVEQGFRNLRLRCNTELFDGDYKSDKFIRFLDALEHVVDKCLDADFEVVPIITWLNRDDEQNSTKKARENYVKWWTAVANRMKSKNYRLSFNLYTEVSETRCNPVGNCTPGAIYDNPEKYNQWTSEVVKKIRGTGKNNEQRILILSSPNMTADGLKSIDKSIYENDKYLMAEFHLYATGPNKYKHSKKIWDGMGEGRENVDDVFKGVEEFTRDSGLYTYFGEWQPNDHTGGGLKQAEVLDFAKYFLQQIRSRGIPWSLNAIQRYYDTRCYPAGECNCFCNDEKRCTKNKKCVENKKCGWFTTPQEIELRGKRGGTQTLDVQEILETIKQNM